MNRIMSEPKQPSMSEALSEAQSIVEAAENRAEEIAKAAEEKGYQAGLDIARQEVAGVAVRMMEDSAGLEDELAHKAARLALSICASIIGEHVKVAPETATRIALKALQGSIIGESSTLVINPSDRPEIEAHLSDLEQLTGGAVRIETNKMIAAGGCMVKTEFGEVDATVESLLKVIAQRLGIQQNGNLK